MSMTKRNYHPITRVLLAMTFLAIAFPVGSFVLLGLSDSGRVVLADDSRSAIGVQTATEKGAGRRSNRSSSAGFFDQPSFERRVQYRTANRVDSKVAAAVREIQASIDDDESRTEKTEILRELLKQKFAKMHDKQAEEIAKTQERLDNTPVTRR